MDKSLHLVLQNIMLYIVQGFFVYDALSSVELVCVDVFYGCFPFCICIPDAVDVPGSSFEVCVSLLGRLREGGPDHTRPAARCNPLRHRRDYRGRRRVASNLRVQQVHLSRGYVKGVCTSTPGEHPARSEQRTCFVCW